MRMFPGRCLLSSSKSSCFFPSPCLFLSPFSILSSSSTARHRSSRVALRCCVMVPASCMPVVVVATRGTLRCCSTFVSKVNTLGPRGTGRGTAPEPTVLCSEMESSEDFRLRFLLLGDKDRERDRFLLLCFLGLGCLSSISLFPSSLELPLLLLLLGVLLAPGAVPEPDRPGMEVNG